MNELGNFMYVAILAGGVGTRLWPCSRRTRPKQFVDLTGSGFTMIQATADRLNGLVPPAQILVVTGTQYASLIAQQLPYLSENQVILEPSGRNTAPAIGLAAIRARRLRPDAVLASLHSDHIIADQAAFQTALRCAAEAAQDGYIVTLGIRPTCPHTGYGYIHRAPEPSVVTPGCLLPVYPVARFLEKPSLDVAKSFVAGGAHYWNAGIFIARVDRLLAEYQRQLPELYGALHAIDELFDSDLAVDDMRASFENIWQGVSSISFDHGIMEDAERVAVVPLDAGWNDVGSWDALEEVLPIEIDSNYVVRGNLISIDSSHNIISSQGDIVALVGVDDLVVVNTGDALLVGRKDQMQRVREVVDILAKEGHAGLL